MSVKKGLFITVVLTICACGEKLMEKPEGLIPKEKMVAVLADMAIVNSAKGTNIGFFRDYDIEPTMFVFEKHGIDSVLFVTSDRYYASLPVEYEAIYTEVELLLTNWENELKETKKLGDSLRRIELESKQKLKDSTLQKVNDSLP
ncbi:DUF4296 domain-containing protein [Maribacter algicola]|uniref:DUF4296 domain-containing protein n=1 Tax=Meishania litoralis TaxID=3434685 RepID=A0ACC7LIV1_9FLAO